MDLISLVVMVIVACLLFWAVRTLLAAFGVGDPIASVVYVLMVLIFVLWLLGALGMGGSFFHLGATRIR
jgi:hypothetical protein